MKTTFSKFIPHQIKKSILSTIGYFQSKSYIDLLDLDRVPRPHYGYCILKAAEQAIKLNYNKISIIEFGVAGGNGLINIEWHVSEIKKFIDLEFEIYGFDSGKGLPKPSDPRDLPYLWFEGDFTLDKIKLQNYLQCSKLVIGDVKDTVNTFYDKYNPAPIGCVFEDLDYYTSTFDSFSLFDTESKNYLPRIPIYFDDLIGRFEFPINDFVGELAAINEFNKIHKHKKIGKINQLKYKRKIPAKWNEQIYIFQDFHHPRYDLPIRDKQPYKSSLRI